MSFFFTAVFFVAIKRLWNIRTFWIFFSNFFFLKLHYKVFFFVIFKKILSHFKLEKKQKMANGWTFFWRLLLLLLTWRILISDRCTPVGSIIGRGLVGSTLGRPTEKSFGSVESISFGIWWAKVEFVIC